MKKIFIILPFLCFLTISKSYCSGNSNEDQLAVEATNMLKNGDFSDSLKSWFLIGQGVNSFHPEDPGRASFKVENRVLEVNITNSGLNIYSIMIYQAVALKKDSTYTASFYARSDSSIPIISNFTQDGTYTNFSGDREFKLTNVRTKYSYDFKMTKNLTLLFQYCLGYMGTGSIFLDSITVDVKPGVQTGMEIQKNQKSGINIFPNPAIDQFSVEADGEPIQKVELLNMAGQLVDSRVYNSNQVVFERNKILSGAYFCKTYTKKGISVGKVLFE